MNDFEAVRTIMRQIAEMMETMWIERESMKMVLNTIYGACPETIEGRKGFARYESRS